VCVYVDGTCGPRADGDEVGSCREAAIMPEAHWPGRLMFETRLAFGQGEPGLGVHVSTYIRRCVGALGCQGARVLRSHE
jgi:hypothetical protein